MTAADTNVLVRILADVPVQPVRVWAARVLATQSEQVCVPRVAHVETA